MSIVSGIEAKIKEGNYYEAQQYILTSSHRFIKQEKIPSAIKIILLGLKSLIHVNQYTLGKELCIELIDRIFSKNEISPSSHIGVQSYTALDVCNMVIDYFPTERYDEREEILDCSIEWTSKYTEGEISHEMVQGDVSMHQKMAMLQWKKGCYHASHKHFCRCDDVSNHGDMIVDWAKKGMQSERDLFIARAVLNLMVINRRNDASKILMNYMKSQDPTFAKNGTPLIHFLKFLNIAIDRKNPHLFQMLRTKYKPTLNRDSSFSKLLDVIGNKYFGITIPKPGGMAGIFQGLMGNIFGS